LPRAYSYRCKRDANDLQRRRASALNDIVCFTFESRDIRREAIEGIEVHEPLRSWPSDRFADACPWRKWSRYERQLQSKTLRST